MQTLLIKSPVQNYDRHYQRSCFKLLHKKHHTIYFFTFDIEEINTKI